MPASTRPVVATVPPSSNNVFVASIDSENRVLAQRQFAPGETVLHLYGEPRNRPERYTIQIDENLHLDATDSSNAGQFYSWRYLNHACEPNTRVRGRDLIALRTIEPGDEITFNYNTTEYDMASPFTCGCGSSLCVSKVGGFRHLTEPEQNRLLPLLARYLKQRLDPA